ncbi:MAG: LamG-like jellyroll fold domain-containing protein [Verrucomicrobiota bacterium]
MRLFFLTIFVGLSLAMPSAGESLVRLLVELDARNFENGRERWPQHGLDRGIAGDFVAKGSPTRQSVGGAEAVVFDGDGDYFIGPVTTAALHGAGAPHSVEVWAFQGNVREQESLVSWGKRLGPERSFAGFRYGSDLDFGAIGRWGSSESGFTTVPQPGVWHHLAYTYDGDVQAVYVDGRLDNARSVGVLDAHDMLPIHLGAEIGGDLKLEGSFTHFSGALATVRIYAGALDAEQVKLAYEKERPRFPGLIAKPLLQSPMHRFSFDVAAGAAADGTIVTDSIGGLTAMVRGDGARFNGRCLELPGGSSSQAAYLDFPNGLVSSRENVSIEFWVAQTGVEVWSRILSIGTNLGGEIQGAGGDFSGSETLTLFGNVGAANVNRFARSNGIFPNGGPDRNPAEYPDTDLGREFQQVITYDKALKEWHWYRNAVLMEVIPDGRGSTQLDDVNVWLGRSEFSSDDNFKGRIREFRIYNHALSEGEIYGNLLAGPGMLNLGGNSTALHWAEVEAGKYSYRNRGGSNHWKTGPDGPSPDGPGRIATLASGLRGDQELVIDRPVTLGSLNLGSRSRSGAFRLSSAEAGTLKMASGSSIPATIFQLSGSLGNTIDVPLELSGETEISNASESPLVVSGKILGHGPLVKSGSGSLILSGHGKDFTGEVKIIAGSLLLGDAGSTGSLGASRYTITQPGELIVNRADALELEGSYEGSGNLRLQGGGTVLLAREGKISTSGDVLVHAGAGTFTNDGTIEGPRCLRAQSEVVFGGRSKSRFSAWISVGFGRPGVLVVKDSATVVIEGAGHLNVGDIGSGQSVLRMEGGSMSFKEFFIGKNNGASGVLIQTGGNLIKSGDFLDARLGGFQPGQSQTWGAWRMTGGSYVDDWNLQIGGYGAGVMEVDGGTVSVDGFLSVGRYEDDPQNPGNGVLDVRSGTVTATSPDRLVLVGEDGIGVITLREKGTLICANRMVIGAGTIEKPGEGTVNLLTGGTLVTKGIGQYNQTEAIGRINLDGGLLKAAASSGEFLDFIDHAEVRSGHARINTAGFDIRIAQPLLAPRGQGVVNIPVISPGQGFLAPPVIQINGGGGNGATAFAEVKDGKVQNILITNAGVDYLSAPSVVILGGGSGTGLRLGKPVLGNNRSGGLVKSGEGILTLDGENTFTGVTRVLAGGLSLRGEVAGAVVVAQGATLEGSGRIGKNLTLEKGAILAGGASCALEVMGDAVVKSSWMLGTSGDAGCMTVHGELDLSGARLQAKMGSGSPSPVRVIARYGSLKGRFSLEEPLPSGYVLDYRYHGQKQIALVAAAADAE